MNVLNRRCAGLDVHKDEVVGCVRLAGRGKASQAIQRFSTKTRGLLELADWLEASGVMRVAMEATGIYWKPVWHVLEERFQLVLANPAHVRNIPRRKSDVNDATWIAELMTHGLIQASFVSPAPSQELRDLSRTRKQLGREIVQHTQRIQKALIAGESDARALAALGGTRLKCSRQELKDGLEGWITTHHRFLIGQHLRMIEELEAAQAAFDARIEAALAPFRDAADRLMSLPDISFIAAQVILAEIGPDMRMFPTAGHLLSWAGLTPRLDESAGKQRSTRVKNGAPWLKPVLVQRAFAAARTKNSYLRAQFRRLKARRGPEKAAIAVAASILNTVYQMLRDGTHYADLGPDHFVRYDKARAAMHLVRRIKDLGYDVGIKAAA